jgi:hypothetical protein
MLCFFSLKKRPFRRIDRQQKNYGAPPHLSLNTGIFSIQKSQSEADQWQ